MKIFDPTLTTLERALDVRLARHGVLAGNVANANTPGFAAQDLDFASAMQNGVGAPAAPEVPMPRSAMTFASAGHAVGGSAGDIPLDVAGAGAPAAPPWMAASPLSGAPSSGAGLDGNSVDVDRALAALAENAIQYGAAARAAQKKLAILRYVASDGTA